MSTQQAPTKRESPYDLFTEDKRDRLPPAELILAMQVRDYPRNELDLSCETCGRSLHLRTHRLIAEYGARTQIAEIIQSKTMSCTAAPDISCRLVLSGGPRSILAADMRR